MSDETSAYLHQPGQAERRWMGDTSTCFLATGEETGGTFCLVDEQASRGESVPLHRHPDDMESFYRAITLASRPGGLPPLDSIQESQIKQASEDYGVEFIGPLPDRSAL